MKKEKYWKYTEQKQNVNLFASERIHLVHSDNNQSINTIRRN